VLVLGRARVEHNRVVARFLDVAAAETTHPAWKSVAIHWLPCAYRTSALSSGITPSISCERIT
jgi:hypothetical protein